MYALTDIVHSVFVFRLPQAEFVVSYGPVFDRVAIGGHLRRVEGRKGKGVFAGEGE